MNLKIAFSRLEPFYNIIFVLQYYREATFRVRIEFLDRIQAFAKSGSSGFFGDGLTRKPVSCPSYQSQFCLMQ